MNLKALFLKKRFNAYLKILKFNMIRTIQILFANGIYSYDIFKKSWFPDTKNNDTHTIHDIYINTHKQVIDRANDFLLIFRS